MRRTALSKSSGVLILSKVRSTSGHLLVTDAEPGFLASIHLDFVEAVLALVKRTGVRIECLNQRNNTALNLSAHF